MNSHAINLPFLAVNAFAIASGVGYTPLYVAFYCIQAYCYIETLRLEQRGIATKKRQLKQEDQPCA